MSQTEYDANPVFDEESADTAKPCSCEKTTCLLGIASIAIGVGGFILAHLI